MNQIQLREICESDLEDVKLLLCEGFQRRSSKYWENALSILSDRDLIEGYPRYGFLLEVHGAAQGVLLLLTSRIDGIVRSNLSSWYVREEYRKYATFMFQRALKTKGGVYLNLSPSPVALPIAKAFGFRPYTDGTWMLDVSHALLKSDSRTSRLDTEKLPKGEMRNHVFQHMRNGCQGVLVEDAAGKMPALYRLKWIKRTLPAARFVFGDPLRLASAAGPLLRTLAMRGISIALVDAPPNTSPQRGIRALPNRECRYAKGSSPPAPGDLLGTEIALFGP